MNQEIDQEAFCTTNTFGRMLGANRRFCRMFGMSPEDVEWRYIHDIHRNEQDWGKFRDAMEHHGKVESFLVRLRHRKGRSFKCLVESVRQLDDNGRPVYQMRIHKVDPVLSTVRTIPSLLQSAGESVVYLTACHACGKVKDSAGSWIEPMRPVAKGSHRNPCYCPECSAQLFPGLLDPQNWDQAVAMAH